MTNKSTPQPTAPTADMIESLRLIQSGADVTSYDLAARLRQIEREFPQLIRITKCQGDYDGAGQMPYFGAITTSAGNDLIAAEDGQHDLLCPDCNCMLVGGCCENCEDGVELD